MKKIRHVAISASAGSGKTFQLAHRYIALLVAGVPADRIAALTFSRKAAGEIFEKIVAYLAEAAGGAAAAGETAKRIGARGTSRQVFLGSLRRLVDNLHRLHIGTLDSFIVGVARAFPAELNIPPTFDVMDSGGSEARDLLCDVLARVFSPLADAERQRDFLQAFKLATFGTSEKGLVNQLVRFIEEHLEDLREIPDPEAWGNPDRIWPDGCRFLRRISGMDDIAAALIQGFSEGAYDARFQQSMLAIAQAARTFGPASAWNKDFENRVFAELITSLDALAAGKGSIMYRKKCITFPTQTSRDLHDLACHVVGTEIHRAIEQTRGIHAILSRYEEEHEEAARRLGKLTFNDVHYLLSGARPPGARISRHADDAGKLYIDYRLDARLDHWLIDEFQDTSDLQWRALSNLADEILQDDTGTRSFFYVGDVKQAIYGWRGGNPRLFGEILATYGARITRMPLNQSFRSCPAVIDTVNRAFSDIVDTGLPDAATDQWKALWHPHTTSPTVPQSGYAALFEVPAGNEGKPGADDIDTAVAGVLNMVQPLRRGLSAAVLMRTNDGVRRVVEALRAECPAMRIAHEGQASLSDSPVVSALLALVRLAAHPGDTFAREHVRMTPLRGVIEALSIPDDDLPHALLEELTLHGFHRFVRRWGENLVRVCPLDDFGTKRLNDLASAAGEFDARGRRDADAFLRFIDDYRLVEQADSAAVRVMTIHQSKGLDFDLVILPDLAGRAMDMATTDIAIHHAPDTRNPEWALRLPRRVVAESDPVLTGEVQAAREESAFGSLCVLYVAMTRAKRALYLLTGYPGKTSRSLNDAAFLRKQLAGERAPSRTRVVPIQDCQLDCFFEQGDPAWYEPLTAPAPEKASPPEKSKRSRGPRRFPRVKLTAVEPSGEAARKRPAASLFHPEMRDVLDFGISIHALFEAVEWADTAEPDAIVADWLELSTVPEAVRRDATEQFRRCLAVPEVQKELSRPDGKVDLWREKSFEVVLPDHRWVSGTFDRVTIRNGCRGGPRATILDFKSNRISRSEEFARAAEEYRPQLLLYREALSRILRISEERIDTKLLFTRAGSVYPL